MSDGSTVCKRGTDTSKHCFWYCAILQNLGLRDKNCKQCEKLDENWSKQLTEKPTKEKYMNNETMTKDEFEKEVYAMEVIVNELLKHPTEDRKRIINYMYDRFVINPSVRDRKPTKENR